MRKKVSFRKVGTVWLFVLPALIPLIVFWIHPILRSVYISFTDWNYMSPTYNFCISFDNFIALFKDARFLRCPVETLSFHSGDHSSPPSSWDCSGAADAERRLRERDHQVHLFSPWIPRLQWQFPSLWTWIYDPDTGMRTQCWNFCIFQHSSGSKALTRPCWRSLS